MNFIEKLKKKGGISFVFNEAIPNRLYMYFDPLVGAILKPIFKTKPLQNIIIIESHNDFDNHGGAFYDYLIKEKYNEKYKIVWFLRNKCKNRLPKNVYSVRYNRLSIKKWYYHCLAKYIICGHYMIETLRENQISIYTTHGSFSLKKAKGYLKLPEGINYYLSSSSKVGPIKADIFGMKYPNNKELVLGFPGHDILYSSDRGDLNKITNQKYNKVFLWMPTFRQTSSGRTDSEYNFELGIPVIETLEELGGLNAFLSKNNSILILKIHPMQDLSCIKAEELSNIFILDGQSVKQKGIDNYRLMKDADAFISDYSSAASDFLNLDRPIAYTIDDIDKYKLGFVVDDPTTLMGGHLIKNYSDLMKYFEDVIKCKDLYQQKRRKIIDYLYEFQDGKSCKRLAEFLKL